MTESTAPQSPIDYGQGAKSPRQTNGFAIASFVLGLFGCIPFVAGLLAVALGVIGIRKGRDRSKSGSGLAIAGLVLGLISLLGWSGFGALLGYGYLESRPAVVVAKQFLADVDAGNTDAAIANSATFNYAQIQTQRLQIAAFGTLQSVAISSFFVSGHNGQTTVHLSGVANFSKGQRMCSFDLAKIAGSFKVTAFLVQ